jgi:hypothetical protein
MAQELEGRNLDELIQSGGVFVESSSLSAYNGPVYRLFEGTEAKIQLRATLRDGVPHGSYEWFHEDGRYRQKGTFNMGEKCGDWFEDELLASYPPCPSDFGDRN